MESCLDIELVFPIELIHDGLQNPVRVEIFAREIRCVCVRIDLYGPHAFVKIRSLFQRSVGFHTNRYLQSSVFLGTGINAADGILYH